MTTVRSNFPNVRILTRDPSSATAQALKSKGAEIYKLDDSPESLDKAFEGVDVVVSALANGMTDEFTLGLSDAVARSSAKLFFLNEFGW